MGRKYVPFMYQNIVAQHAGTTGLRISGLRYRRRKILHKNDTWSSMWLTDFN